MEASTVEATGAEAKRSSSVRATNPDTTLRRLLGLGDALAVSLALVVALVIPGRDHGAWWPLFAVPLIVLLCKLYGLYDRDVKRISHSTVDELPWLFHAIVIGVLLFWLYARATPVGRLDLAETLLLLGSLAILMPSIRALVRQVGSRVIPAEPALVVAPVDLAQTLVRKLRGHPEYRLEVMATLAPESVGRSNGSGPNRPGVDELTRLVKQHSIARVLLAAGDLEERELDAMLHCCRALSLKVSILPRLSDMLGPAVEIDDVEGITVLGLSPPQLPRSSRALKRAIDIAVAGTLLIISAPALVLLALVIKLDSRGPVLFRQERIGKNGRRFRLLKLRTMVDNAEQQREELLAHSVDPNWLSLAHDPRVTRVGRRMRRLSLDELPQLLNVLRGDMSMVGPRPLIPLENERVEAWAQGRLELTPGITGYWQVLGRTRIPFEEMVKLDYLYVVNWSLWEDIRLMLRTLPVVLWGRGAN